MKIYLAPVGPSAAPVHGFTRSTLVSLVVFAAITPLLLLVAPAVAAQLGGPMGLSASQIGTYFFVELGAFSLATVPSYLWLGRVDARRVAGWATAVFCIGNLITALVMPGFIALLALRAVTALGGGTLMVLCMTSAATSGDRDRVYGLWVVGQLVAGALGLFLLPHLFDAFGLRALYVTLALLALCAAPLIRGFDPALGGKRHQRDPHDPRDEHNEHTARVAAGNPSGIANAAFAVAGVLAFYLAIGGVWTFASEAASLAGLDASRSGSVLAIASVMGIAGAGTASLIGGRLARRVMLVAGYGLLFVALAGLSVDSGIGTYMTAIFAFKFAWTFVLPFILAAAANKDHSGRLIASLNFVIGAGLAMGPLIAGVLLDAGASLHALFAGAAAICTLSLICLLRVERS
jgi:predicted MFS family arabinose efflux permease